jgi:conjugal transfer ATP-binding protein TraC
MRKLWSSAARGKTCRPAVERTDEALDTWARFSLGTRTPGDLIAPAAVQVAPDRVRLDRQFVRVLKVTGYPRTVGAGWLEPLFGLGAPVEVSMHLHPLPSGDLVRSLTRKLAQLQSSRLRDARTGRLEDPQREVAFEDAERLRDALQRGEEKVFSASLYVLLRAPSPDALDALTRRVEVTLAAMLVESRVAVFEQGAGLRACLPYARDELLAYRNLDTSSVATTFPFAAATPSTEEGVLYGIAAGSHAPVVLDPFDPALENANHVVFARSGAGKSFATKLLALRQLVHGVDVLVIDPEDEYRRLCDGVGADGQYVRLSSASAHRLNPFDLPTQPAPPARPAPAAAESGGPEGEPAHEGHGAPDAGDAADAADTADAGDTGDGLAEQVASLIALCELMLAEPGARLGPHERAVLDRAMYRTYAAAGITPDPATHGHEAPVMRDLLAVLTDDPDAAADGLVARLGRFVNGSLAGLFAGPTNVALDRPLTVFNVQALEAELRPVAIHLITTFIWGQVRRVRRPRLLVVDEAWTLLQHAEGGAFLAALARRARKYHLGLVCISQDVADFLASEHGRTVLANAAVKLMMKQDPSSIEPVAAALQLSREERRFLLGAGKGDALLLARGARVPLKVEASRHEYRLATTTPADLAATDASSPAGSTPTATAAAARTTTTAPGAPSPAAPAGVPEKGPDHVF